MSLTDLTLSVNFPLISVTVPVFVPFRTTETPTIGSLLTSLIVPVILIISSARAADAICPLITVASAPLLLFALRNAKLPRRRSANTANLFCKKHLPDK